MRMQHRRESYIPKGARKFADLKSSAVVYAYDKAGRFYLIGFHGRAQKPDFHYWYRTPAEREEKAKRTFESRRLTEAFKVEQRASAKAVKRQLEVGDILRCSWGYDQTNIDFFQVTALIGKAMVEIREIAQGSVETASLVGKCVPLKDNFIGDPMRKMAKGDSVRIHSFAHAYKMEPKIVAGVPTYDASNWTAYA